MSVSYEQFLNLEQEMISNMLEENSSMRTQIDGSKVKPKHLSYQEKKLILSELKDVEDITFSENYRGSEIIIHFKPIILYLDSPSPNPRIDRNKIPFYYLSKLGFINFKTSKSRVIITISSAGNISFNTSYDEERKVNFHDWGLNCWGGWTGVVIDLLRSKRYYDAVLNIASRMKQSTITDGSVSYSKMCQFEYENNLYILLNDQEVSFFATEIEWLVSRGFENGSDFDTKEFVKDLENNLYYVDLPFRGQVYRLAMSEEAYSTIGRG